MSHFDSVIDDTLDHEGGFVDNKHDPGGATNWGISLRWLRQQGDIDGDGFLDGDLDKDGDVDADDIEIMTRVKAIHFYKKRFWLDDYDQLESLEVAGKIFDMSVNMGWKQSHKLIQRSCPAYGSGYELVDDGYLGNKSLAAINNIGFKLMPGVRCTMAGFYRSLILRNSALRKNGVMKADGSSYEDFTVFQKGWLRRAYS